MQTSRIGDALLGVALSVGMINGALRSALYCQLLMRSKEVTVVGLPLQPVRLMWTDTSFDETRAHLAQAAVLLARPGEAETALWRLLEAQRKTQKRVNALKYNVIPRYHETLHYIESVLEEEERNTLFQIKVLREQAGDKRRNEEQQTAGLAVREAG